MNELFFLLHLVIIWGITLGALRLGKEALILSFCFQAFLANLLVFKQMSFLGCVITCTDAYIIGCYFSLGLIQHYYGEKLAHKAVSLCFYLLLSFIAISIIHLLYRPSQYDNYHGIYKTLFAITPRAIIASLLIGFASQKCNVYLQNFLANRFPALLHVLHLSIPIVIAQFLDTVAFSFFALYGVVHSLTSVIFMSYVIKLLTIGCMTPFIVFSQRFTPKELS
jgi:uncharacterized integral membrane protein (TIGR00697 family)